jgi:hypothetical protein
MWRWRCSPRQVVGPVFRGVDIAEGSEEAYLEPGPSGGGHGLREDQPGAPINAVKQRVVRRLQTNQPVPAVLGGTQHDINVIKGGPSGINVRPLKSRAVRPNNDDPFRVFGDRLANGAFQPPSKVAFALGRQAPTRGRQRRDFRAGVVRAETEASSRDGIDRVEVRCNQSFVRLKRRRIADAGGQPGFHKSKARRLEKHDKQVCRA